MRTTALIVVIVFVACAPQAFAQGFPAGWTTLTNTPITNVVPANNFCGDGFQFQSNAQYLFGQWSGGAADTNNNRLLVWGGGHGNGFDNSVYALKLNANGTASWSRLMGPTCPTNFGPQANTETLAGGTVPNATQTYGGLFYIPSRNSLLSNGGVPARPQGNMEGNIWEANLTSLTWTSHGTWPWNNCTSCGGVGGLVSGAFDPTSSTAIFYNAYVMYRYNPATFALTLLENNNWATNNHGSTVVDALNHNLVYINDGVFSWYKIDGTDSNYIAHNNAGTCSTGGSNESFVGLTWNPDIGRVVAYPRAGGTSIYVVSFDGANYSCAAQSYSGPSPAPTPSLYAGLFGRFQYLPNLQVYVVCMDVSANCSVLNPSNLTNGFTSRIAGVNVPGGAASIVSNQGFETALPTCSPVSCNTYSPGAQAYVQHFTTPTPSLDSTIKADGNSSLKFTVNAGSQQGDAGYYDYNFSPNFATGVGQYGNGQEFFVQYKVRMDSALLGGGAITNNQGIKHDITTEGDTATVAAPDCSNSPGEVVTVSALGDFQGPAMYHNCQFSGGTFAFMQNIYQGINLGGIASSNFLDQDAAGCPHYAGRGIPISDPTCFIYVGNEWFTIQKHIKVGTFQTPSSVIEQWIAHANNPSVLTTNASDAAIVNNGTGGASGKYGKIQLSTYDTGATFNVNSQVNFDDLIVSTRRIPDPDVATPNAPDSLSLSVATGSVTASWRVNSQNGTGQDDTGFLVERCAGTTQTCFPNPQSGFSQIGTTVAGASSYQDGTVVNGTTYTYRVRAKNGAGNSAYSTAICFSGGPTCGGTAVAQSSGNPVANLSPATLDFGNQLLQSTSSAQNVTLTNTGASVLTITSINITGEYAISSNPCPASLGPGNNCVVSITFSPTVVGSRTGILSVTDNAAGSPHTVSLSGNGTATVFGIGNINIQGNITIKP